MSFVMPEIMLQRVIQIGIDNVRSDTEAFNDIFAQYLNDELTDDYGQTYIDQIREWFTTTKMPVVQAWSFNPDRIPCFSIHLASEQEDEAKAAIGDYWGDDEEGDGVLNTGAFTVFLDVGIHGNVDSDQVIWMYYVLSYILFKEKPLAQKLGLQLQTWNASDYNKERQYMGENIWTRWIRFKCTTTNLIKMEEKTEKEVEVEVEVESGTDTSDDINIIIEEE